jgi:hypothetical protein
MNPPYSRGNLPEWTAKAADETYPYTDRKTAILVFGVLPFDMVGWFRNNVRDRATLFIPDARIPFIDPETGQLENSPRQNTLFALWETGERPKKPQILIYRDMMIEYLTDHNWELTDYALLEYKPILELIAEHKKAQSTAGEGGK